MVHQQRPGIPWGMNADRIERCSTPESSESRYLLGLSTSTTCRNHAQQAPTRKPHCPLPPTTWAAVEYRKPESEDRIRGEDP
jgi:hypothetical protein